LLTDYWLRPPYNFLMTQKSTTAANHRPDPGSLTVVNYPDPILKKTAKDVEEFDAWLRAVVERMKALMVEHKGVGLAAREVGLGIRLFVWSPEGKAEEARAFINPVFSEEAGSESGEEGCLSLPDIRAKITRYKHVKVEAQDEHGREFVVDL